MYDHIGLKVKNLDASVRFYTRALAPLGYELCSRDESSAGFGPKGNPALWLYAAPSGSGTGVHVAFRAPNRAAHTPTIGAADMFGLPVSTTHVLSSGVAGAMTANKSGLQIATIRNLLMAWVLTLPAAVVLSGCLYWLFRQLF